jgi:hypothetical protein
MAAWGAWALGGDSRGSEAAPRLSPRSGWSRSEAAHLRASDTPLRTLPGDPSSFTTRHTILAMRLDLASNTDRFQGVQISPGVRGSLGDVVQLTPDPLPVVGAFKTCLGLLPRHGVLQERVALGHGGEVLSLLLHSQLARAQPGGQGHGHCVGQGGIGPLLGASSKSTLFIFKRGCFGLHFHQVAWGMHLCFCYDFMV